MKRHRPPQRLDQLIRSAKDEYDLPEGLTDRVQRAVAATPQQVAPRRPVRGLAYGAAVLVGCAVLVAAMLLWPRPEHPTPSAVATGSGHGATAPQAATKKGPDSVADSRRDDAVGENRVVAFGPKPPTGHATLGPRVVSATHVDQQLVAVVAAQQPAKVGSGRALAVGDRLPAGSVLRTGAGGRLTVVTRHGSEFTLGPGSELALSNDGRSGTLRRGRLYCRNRQHEFAAIATSAGRIELLGTVVDAAIKERREVAVTVVEGRVRLANAHGQAVVNAGRRALLIAQLPPSDGEVVNTAAETAWYDGRGSVISDFGEIAYSVQRAQYLLMEAWAMNADGSNKHRVRSYVGGYSWADKWQPGERRLWLQVLPPVWTMPDDATRTAASGRGAGMIDGKDRSWLLDAATAQDAPLVLPAGFLPPMDAALSPDGRRLAFDGGRRTGPNEMTDWEAGIWIYDLVTGEVTKLIDRGWEQPAWSPDGRTIALSESHGSNDKYRLILVRVSDGKVTDLGVEGVRAAFSPDGTRLAYIDDYQKDFPDGWWASYLGRAYVLDLVHGGAPRLISPATERAAQPRWSPDGTQLLLRVVSPVQDERPTLTSRLCVAAADGSSLVDAYTPSDGHAGLADWAPSGEQILTRTDKGVVVLAADGSGVVAELGGTKADSQLRGAEAEQTEATAAAVNEAVFQYAVGKVREFQGRTTEAVAAYRAAAAIFEGLPWRFPLADLSTGNVLGYADEVYALAGRTPEAMRTATCKTHLNDLGLLLPWYANEHNGVFPTDLSALEPWAAASWSKPGNESMLNEFLIGDPDIAQAMIACPGGDAYVYTPPVAGQVPQVGDTLLTCPKHPQFSIVWERNDDGKLEPKHLEGYSIGPAGRLYYMEPAEREAEK